MKKNEIIALLDMNKKEIQDRFHVTKIGLFGSYANDMENDGSDIDIIVDGKKILDEELRIFLESKFHKKVDIVKRETLYHFMKFLIDEEAIYV
ncbi:MAG: nucleotidyltransferase domain-containing protein [Candidatus Cloacimonadales bacterium]|nr:nucleotidyltransferase domain-containing protein [Candidatus Cloacimonadales bacterium]